MQRGEAWWAQFDERRPVVLVSGDEASGFLAVQVVAPADVSINGLGVEVAVGAEEGLPFSGVLRFAFPRPGYIPCTWMTTLSGDDLIERAGALPAAKVAEIEDAIRICEQPRAWTPATTAQFNEIRNALRAGGSFHPDFLLLSPAAAFPARFATCRRCHRRSPDPVAYAIDRIGQLSPTPSTSPIGTHQDPNAAPAEGSHGPALVHGFCRLAIRSRGGWGRRASGDGGSRGPEGDARRLGDD